MGDFHDVDDAAANLLERRWFVAAAKVKALQEECDVMRCVMGLAEQAYRDARGQLAEMEALCDGLAQRLERLEEVSEPAPAFIDADRPLASRELSAA